ncbi:MAG: SemiSWEET transporter [Vicinamibacterales bacterium]
MHFSATDLVGMLAGTLTTVAFIPQVIKAWRTQSVDDLSIWMLLSFTTGVVLWALYGVAVQSTPVIVTNVVTFLLSLALLGMKVRM